MFTSRSGIWHLHHAGLAHYHMPENTDRDPCVCLGPLGVCWTLAMQTTAPVCFDSFALGAESYIYSELSTNVHI